jgi:TolA-binding protein
LLENDKKSEEKINNQQENISKLERENQKIILKAKDLEESLSQAENDKSILDQKYRDLTYSYNRLKTQADKLSEDIQVIEKSKEVLTPRKNKNRRHISLMSELEEINTTIPEETTFKPFTLKSPESQLTININLNIIHISGKKSRELNKRKDPLEEYFTLV